MICLWLVLWIADGMTKFNTKTITLMNSFIADYLQDPSLAVAAAQASCRQTMWLDNIDEDEISGETFVEQRNILKNIIDNFDKYKEIINNNLRN